MAAIAIPEPPVEQGKTVEREEPLERDKALDRYETIECDPLDNERLEPFGSRSPVRGIMIAVPVGAGLWALLISLVRLALS